MKEIEPGMRNSLKARAKNNAFILLRSRPRSEFEMRERLKLKGYNSLLVDEVINDLKRQGHVNDEKFAKLWVDSRMYMSPVGDVILRYELKKKGISDSIINATLEAKNAGCDEYAVAFNMAKERFERFKKLDRRKATKRVYDFLLRRGFKYDTVRSIIEKLMEVEV